MDTIVRIILFPITVVGHLAGYRRVSFFTDRIGHLAAEPDCLLKMQALDMIPKRRWLLVASPWRIANEALLDYWRPHIRVIDGSIARYAINRLGWKGLMSYPADAFILAFDSAASYYEVSSKWGDRLPLLEITQDQEERGWAMLKRTGIPRDSWFVCFHAREGGFSPVDEELHDHRNGDIHVLKSAMEEVIKRGGWCIRMGDASMKPMPSPPNVIDYAHSPDKTAWMDIFLCAKCKLFVGCTSGLFIVSTVFGVPCALANMIPTDTLGFTSSDLSIPKLLRDHKTNDYLAFSKIFNTPVSSFRYARQYADAGIIVEENTEEEIRDLVVEALDRLDRSWQTDPGEQELQMAFKKLLQPHHYGFGSAARVGHKFLQKHRRLLGESTQSTSLSTDRKKSELPQVANITSLV